MKIILLIQTGIIIALGYFLYQEIMEDQAVVTEVVVEPAVATSTKEAIVTTPTSTEETVRDEVPVITEDLDGHNDAGMEWPVLQ